MGEPVIRVKTLYSDLAASMEALRSSHAALDRSREVVESALRDGSAHYGINTGFGILASERIAEDMRAQLQKNILLSHACGVSDPVPSEITRLMLPLKIHAPGLGQSRIPRASSEQSPRCCTNGLTVR